MNWLNKQGKVTLLGAGCSLLLLADVAASWALIHDFEAYSVLDPEDVPHHEVAYAVYTGSGSFQEVASENLFRIYREDDESENQGLHLNWHTEGALEIHTWTRIPIPEIASGSTGTVYFRVKNEGHYVRWGVGVSDAENILMEWDERNTQLMWYGWETPGVENLQAYTGGYPHPPLRFHPAYVGDEHYGKTSPVLGLGVGEWHEFWMVVRNSANPAQKNYWVYHRSAGMESPELLHFGDALPKSRLPMWSESNGAISSLIIDSIANLGMFSVGWRHHWLIDDIHVDPVHANLGNPRIGDDRIIHLWEESGWMEREPFGQVYAVRYPWLYSLRWNNWLMLHGHGEEEDGVWVFVPKRADPL